MTLNKRERRLLILLAAIGLAFVYYKFLMTPLYTGLQELQIEKQQQQEAYDVMQQMFDQEIPLDEQIVAATDGSKQLTGDLFGKLTQEDILVLFYDLLNGKQMELTKLNFSEPYVRVSTLESGDKQSDEATADNQGSDRKAIGDQGDVQVYSLQLHYQAEYQELLGFLEAIREYERRIAVSNLQVTDITDGVLTGDMAVDFYSVPYVDEYYPERVDVLAAKAFDFDKIKLENPFVFFRPDDVVPEEIEPYPDSVPWEEAEQEPVVENWVTLYGFDDQRYFFVGNPREVYGSVLPEQQNSKGKPSVKMQYDFLRERGYHAANLVFDGDAVQVIRQPELLGVPVYAYETNGHKIGLIVIDSGGRQYKVPLTEEVNWVGWQTLKAKLPIEVTYPALVQRIYIESDQASGKLKGSFLFDTLEALYPDMPSGVGEGAVKNE